MSDTRKISILLPLTLVANLCLAQVISLGESSTLSIGSSSTFFTGSSTSFKGTLKNEGTIISYGEVDFVDNTDIGNLKLVGDNLQEIYGGNLEVNTLEVGSSSTVLIRAAELSVLGDFDVQSGIVQTAELSRLIVLGTFIPSGGFVEGSIVGRTRNTEVTFPMGVGQFANYISLSSTEADITTTITCQVPPNVSELVPTDEMVGIADEVEWIIQTDGEETDANVTVDFSGLDFLNFSNGQPINADVYAPALVVFQNGDTTYRILESVEATPQNAAANETSGKIVSNTSITIGPEPTRLSVAWIPIVDDPEFFVPNAFSPTAFQQENRVFRPFFSGGEVSSISISVYNSFNKEIYTYNASGEDLDLTLVGWNGKLNGGQEAEAGVYYYTIQLIADGQVYQKTSSVLLAN